MCMYIYIYIYIYIYYVCIYIYIHIYTHVHVYSITLASYNALMFPSNTILNNLGTHRIKSEASQRDRWGTPTCE